MLYIGIDLGTSSVKLLLMNEKGAILKTVSREYPLFFPRAGWSEQNPEDWLRETAAGIRELTADVEKSEVAGIGCCGQMHGLVALDKDDRVIRPAILWNDGRTSEETNYLNTVIGRDKLSEYTANIAFAGFTAPKVLWVKKHEPENFAKISKIMLPKDYINYMLTGTFCTDVSDASGMLLFDVKNKRWSKEMLDVCGLKEEQLPQIFESAQVVGTLKDGIAAELGLPNTVKVCAGAGDNAGAAVGTGTVGDGICNISLGTSGTIFITSKEFRVDPNNALHAFAHADGNFHLMGCMLSAASCNKWWQDNVICSGDYAGEEAKIPEELLGKNRVFFLPYLMGERSPINDTEARGAFIGLSADTDRAAMRLAILEGVAFAMRDSFEVAKSLGLNITVSRICGGGAKSPLWRRIFANVLNIDICTPETEEGPSYGGAILAAVACGERKTVQQASTELFKVKEMTSPEPELAALYEERYKQFKQIYPTLKGLFPVLNKM
ncbi:MAG: xylulokinase [Lachnospiraceae bacterium]|nr:xylulokinase [Ruminococcus sp.]MCM1274930.1 xylulokinase [Lachnospiraceae bacterium]